jgi:hypothetical protein
VTSNPTPGSDDAIAQGCTCPVLDNGRGRGAYQIDGKRQFWIAFGCPVHQGVEPLDYSDSETDDGMDH